MFFYSVTELSILMNILGMQNILKMVAFINYLCSHIKVVCCMVVAMFYTHCSGPRRQPVFWPVALHVSTATMASLIVWDSAISVKTRDSNRDTLATSQLI